MDRIFCTGCGKSCVPRCNETLGSLEPCESCGKVPVDPMTLLIDLKISSATHRICLACGKGNRFDRFCYGCGAQLGD